MIDPVGSTTSAATPASSVLNPMGQLGKDEFLKMLVAQLKNQDPMNPMEAQDMAAQLAQFSSLEQLINIGQQLAGQDSANSAMIATLNGTAAMGMIGKQVTALGDSVAVSTGSESVTVNVGAGGGTGTLHIYDANGAEVGTRALGTLAAGKQSIALGSAAQGLPAGTYTYAVEVTDGSGTAVDVTQYVTGRVDGVRYGQGGPVLTAGGIEISFGSIVQIDS